MSLFEFLRRAACASCAALWASAPATAWAADAPVDPEDSLNNVRWALGMVFRDGPIYFGQQQRGQGVQPLVALRWGKLRISNSGASGLLGEGAAGGASAEVYSSEEWKVRLGLRIDRGRRIKADAQERLSELPRVRSTVRARLMLTRSLPADASVSLILTPDLLGREGGTAWQLGVYKRLTAPASLAGLGGQWSASVSLNGGDERYMNSYFGIPERTRLYAPYEAEGGARDLSAGLGWQRAFGPRERWVLFAGAGAQRLLGSAAKAPFVQRANAWNAHLGLAYRH